MTRSILMSSCLAALFMTACATTKPAIGVEVHPIVQSAALETRNNFDAQAAMDSARKYLDTAEYVASYTAYKTVLIKIDAGDDKRRHALLGLADSALALAWQDVSYENQARKFYKKVAADEKSSDELIRKAEAGLLLLELTDYTPEAAQKRLIAALEDNQYDPRLWNALGKMHDGNSDWLDALDAYIKALSAAKKNGQCTAAVVNNMGMSLLMQGRKKEALAKFKQAKKASPEMPVYDNNLRLAQTLSGKTNKALKGLSDTRAAQIYNDAGVIAQTQGQQTKAASLYKKAIETSPIYFELAEENLAGLG